MNVFSGDINPPLLILLLSNSSPLLSSRKLVIILLSYRRFPQNLTTLNCRRSVLLFLKFYQLCLNRLFQLSFFLLSSLHRLKQLMLLNKPSLLYHRLLVRINTHEPRLPVISLFDQPLMFLHPLDLLLHL